MKRPHRAEKAPVPRRAQPGQKKRTGGSPGSGSPRRKQAERRGRRELLGDRERGSAEKTCGGRRKDGRASLREQRAPSKKEKEVRRKEEMWKQLKKHRCVVTRLQARFNAPSPSCQPCSLPCKGQVPSSLPPPTNGRPLLSPASLCLYLRPCPAHRWGQPG